MRVRKRDNTKMNNNYVNESVQNLCATKKTIQKDAHTYTHTHTHKHTHTHTHTQPLPHTLIPGAMGVRVTSAATRKAATDLISDEAGEEGEELRSVPICTHTHTHSRTYIKNTHTCTHIYIYVHKVVFTSLIL